MYTAAASYLDARANEGRWLVRVEDLDIARTVKGATARILDTLRKFGFEWDDAVIHQTTRSSSYTHALDALHEQALTYECSCSRSQLADEEHYPGYCRLQPLIVGKPTATRLRVDAGTVQFTDRIQGIFRQNLQTAVGDVVLCRRDRVISYLLAVVVDDAAQQVTHVVRGADLLDNTPRQIFLQEKLALPRPAYAHVPVLTEACGKKLAKSARSVCLTASSRLAQLTAVFNLLGLDTPPQIAAGTLAQAWDWAIAHWDIQRVPKRLSLALDS